MINSIFLISQFFSSYFSSLEDSAKKKRNKIFTLIGIYVLRLYVCSSFYDGTMCARKPACASYSADAEASLTTGNKVSLCLKAFEQIFGATRN